jgi:hypothetical protein
MAVFFANTLVTTSDYLKMGLNYTLPQSLSRAKKQGRIQVLTIGGLQFVEMQPEIVQQLYKVPSWQSLATVAREQLPHTLASLNNLSKLFGVNEGVILGWALFHHLDAYWIAGRFFMESAKAKQVALQMGLKLKQQRR